jgi:hypothetical protein
MGNEADSDSGQMKLKFVECFTRLDGKLDNISEGVDEIKKRQECQDTRLRGLEDERTVHRVKLEQGSKTFLELRSEQKEIREKVATKMSSADFESRFKTQLYKVIGATVIGGGAAAAALFKVFGGGG